MTLSSKNTMTRDAMMFLPAKVVEGLLVIACSSLYTHIFVEGAVTGFNLTNTTVQLIYLILAGWMANSATRYVGEEYRADSGRGLCSRQRSGQSGGTAAQNKDVCHADTCFLWVYSYLL